MSYKRITVVKEDENGRNMLFRDNSTRRHMTRAEFVRKINSGSYPGYHVRKNNGLKTPVSNPDSSGNNNLG